MAQNLRFYVFYFMSNYLTNKKRTQAQQEVLKKQSWPEEAKQKFSSATNALIAARQQLIGSVGILRENSELATFLSQVYTDFIFGNDDTVISEKNRVYYDNETIKNFKEIFNESNLNKKLNLIVPAGTNLNLLSYNQLSEWQSLDRVIYEKDNTTEKLKLQEFGQKIQRYLDMARKLGQSGNFNGAEAKRLQADLYLLQNTLDQNYKSAKSGKTKGVVYYDLTTTNKNKLIDLVKRYNDLVWSSKAHSTMVDQGYYGEALIAAINKIITTGAYKGTKQLLKRGLVEKITEKGNKRFILNDFVTGQLKMIGEKTNSSEMQIDNNVFDLDILNNYFKSIKTPNVEAKIVKSQTGHEDLTLTMKQKSTADVDFSWEGMDYGISVKNYRKGFQTSKGVSIISKTPLLTLLSTFPSAFIHHFANITSSLHKDKEKDKAAKAKVATGYNNMRQQMKAIIALALMIRGLSGTKNSNQRVGGEADFFTMIDSSSQKVIVYTTASLIRAISQIFEKKYNNSIAQDSGFIMRGYPAGPIFKNEFVPAEGDEFSISAAKRRNANYIIEAHKIKLSASISKAGWNQITPYLQKN